MKHIDENEINYTEEELFWISSTRKGRLKSTPNAKKIIKQLEKAAEKTLRKDARISLRMTSEDVERLKRLAAREGIPYQTYITSVLHKFVNRQLPLE